jgi:hypothetical protein
MSRFAGIVGTLLLMFFASVAIAQAPRSERVSFARGATDTTVRGTIRGYETVNYLLSASAGQRLVASFQTDNPRAFFNVTPPGAVEAMFIGSAMGNQFDAIIPSRGDYIITVYLMRNAAQRGELSNYYLTIGAYGRPTPPPPIGPGGGFWQVTGLTPGDTLNLREQPSTQAMVLLKFFPGQILRDLGCTMTGGQQWCQVQAPDWTSPRGWVAARYLTPVAAPPPGAGYPPPYPGYPPVVLPPPPRPPVVIGPPRTAKCRQNSTICTSEATRLCGGSYRVLDSESHAGGLVTDAVPGPFIWYSMRYVCAPFDGRYPTFSFRGPPPTYPGIGGPGGGPRPVEVSEMQRYCRGEAADKFRQRPNEIATEKPDRRNNGSYIVRGRFRERGKAQTFACTFGKRGFFQEVVLVSR